MVSCGSSGGGVSWAEERCGRGTGDGSGAESGLHNDDRAL